MIIANSALPASLACNRPHFLWVYRRDNPLGMLENTRKACKSPAEGKKCCGNDVAAFAKLSHVTLYARTATDGKMSVVKKGLP